jgi:hypothetical protein
MRATFPVTLAAAAMLLVAGEAKAHWGVHGHWHHGTWAVGGHVVWPVGVAVGPAPSVVDFNVEPRTTKIWVDGTFRGICDEFDGYPQKMYLAPGRHHIRLVAPDGCTVERTVELGRGYELNLDVAF